VALAIDRAVLAAGFSTRRAADAVLISRRLTTDTTPPAGADHAALAHHASELRQLANRLAEVGRREQALEPAQRAVGIYSELAEAKPDTYLPNLSTSLNNLAVLLDELGDPNASTIHQRSEVLRKQLESEQPPAIDS